MPEGPIDYQLRSFRQEDQQVCQHLYHEGITVGKLADNDSGLDIDDIHSAYMKPEGNHFWVAETGGKVVGMIGVMLSDGTGEIRRLRVADGYRRRGIGTALLKQAVEFCGENNYLKVAIDTYVDRNPALQLLEENHYKLGTTRSYGGKELLVFYLDIYSSEGKDGE